MSVGIPVFQGEEFLDETLTALRGQDYPNLEIMVSDNASTDSTPEIVARHEAEDPRVHSIRQAENLGAAENYNEVFRAANGTYFAWNAHDDLTTPDFFSAGVAALEADPTAVVAIARPFRVAVDGTKMEEFSIPDELGSDQPHIRFRAAARSNPGAIVFGLYRSEHLARTHLHAHFSGSDRNFVAEMMLYGRLIRAGDSEFYLREHQYRSVRSHGRAPGNRLSHARDAWYDPSRENRIVFPNWRRVGGYLGAVAGAPLGFRQAALCYFAVARLLVDDRMKLTKQLGYDLLAAGAGLLGKLRSRR